MSNTVPALSLIEQLLAEYFALNASLRALEKRKGDIRTLLMKTEPGAYGAFILAITEVSKPEHIVHARTEQHVRVSRRD